ncbi:MAG TPA: citryl-CoA lyase [Steroidobacteraceae bacterium]|nr:citryl-CoA lyase [Steroidobacteraceae bacterium]
MKIGPPSQHATAICGSTDAGIWVRGRDLAADLMGKISFTDYFWLLVTGTSPTPAQSRILDATLVAIAEHGLVPSVQAGRMTLAAAPEALQGAVAAGLLGCGSVILGSAEAAGRFFAEISSLIGNGREQEVAAAELVREYRAERRAIPGYGHPLHKRSDPRAEQLLAIAQEVGTAGRYADVTRTVERLLPELIGKPLTLNVSGAIAAVLLDAGYPLRALKGVPLLARAGGLLAHLVEEQVRPIGFAMSAAAAEAIDYDGDAPPGPKPKP